MPLWGRLKSNVSGKTRPPASQTWIKRSGKGRSAKVESIVPAAYSSRAISSSTSAYSARTGPISRIGSRTSSTTTNPSSSNCCRCAVLRARIVLPTSQPRVTPRRTSEYARSIKSSSRGRPIVWTSVERNRRCLAGSQGERLIEAQPQAPVNVLTLRSDCLCANPHARRGRAGVQQKLVQAQLPIREAELGAFVLAKRAPAAGGDKESAEVPRVDARSERQTALDGVVVIAAGSFQQGPTRHGADVVIAAFHLVPGAAPCSVVPLAHVGQHGDGAFDIVLEEQQTGDRVLQPAPDLVAVLGWHLRPATVRPGTDVRAAVPLIHVDPWLLVGLLKALTPIEVEDILGGCLNVLSGEHVAETERMRPPLTEQLVHVAASAEL